MKRAFLSFAVATMALILLYFFVAITISLEDYQQFGQKRMEAQLISQRFQDSADFFNATVADAINDAALNSTFSGSCRPFASPPAGTFRKGLDAALTKYLNASVARLSTDSVMVTYGWNSSSLVNVMTSFEDLTTTVARSPYPCGNNTNDMVMSRIITDISFRVNVTSRDGSSGYFNRFFEYRYETLLNRSGTEFYIRLSPENQPDTAYRCIRVTGCP